MILVILTAIISELELCIQLLILAFTNVFILINGQYVMIKSMDNNDIELYIVLYIF